MTGRYWPPSTLGRRKQASCVLSLSVVCAGAARPLATCCPVPRAPVRLCGRRRGLGRPTTSSLRPSLEQNSCDRRVGLLGDNAYPPLLLSKVKGRLRHSAYKYTHGVLLSFNLPLSSSCRQRAEVSPFAAITQWRRPSRPPFVRSYARNWQFFGRKC
jgi:hypothetical protein